MIKHYRSALPYCLIALALASSALATGCYGAHALPGASAAPIPASAIASVGPTPGEGAMCSGRSPQPTNTTWSVDVGGKKREFVVHIPPSYDPSKAMPVVLNFHGYSMSPKLEEWLTSMSAKADAARFILVYPAGTGSTSGFNAGSCCGQAMNDNVDDVGFTRAMLDKLEIDLCIDTRRVFATGMSNGGFMSHRLACDMSERIAAIAAVSGVNGVAECPTSRPVPVLHFHGSDDPTIPYNGNTDRHWRSVDESTKGWVTRDGCAETPVETLAKGDTRCVSYNQCKGGAEVALCTIQGGGHTWPGGADIPGIVGQGKTSHDIVANDLIWSFFEKHPMPGPGVNGAETKRP